MPATMTSEPNDQQLGYLIALLNPVQIEQLEQGSTAGCERHRLKVRELYREEPPILAEIATGITGKRLASSCAAWDANGPQYGIAVACRIRMTRSNG